MNKIKQTQKLPSRETETRAKTERRKPWSPPSQVAIAKKLGVPLSEYAKYVKE